jgi:hypothetical protein
MSRSVTTVDRDGCVVPRRIVEKGWMLDQAYPLVIEAEVGEAKQGLGALGGVLACQNLRTSARHGGGISLLRRAQYGVTP